MCCCLMKWKHWADSQHPAVIRKQDCRVRATRLSPDWWPHPGDLQSVPHCTALSVAGCLVQIHRWMFLCKSEPLNVCICVGGVSFACLLSHQLSQKWKKQNLQQLPHFVFAYSYFFYPLPTVEMCSDCMKYLWVSFLIEVLGLSSVTTHLSAEPS